MSNPIPTKVQVTSSGAVKVTHDRRVQLRSDCDLSVLDDITEFRFRFEFEDHCGCEKVIITEGTWTRIDNSIYPPPPDKFIFRCYRYPYSSYPFRPEFISGCLSTLGYGWGPGVLMVNSDPMDHWIEVNLDLNMDTELSMKSIAYCTPGWMAGCSNAIILDQWPNYDHWTLENLHGSHHVELSAGCCSGRCIWGFY